MDNSGKTTLVQRLNPKKNPSDVVPTVGFQVEEFVKNNINFTIFDMSGQGRYRSLWEQYYKDVEAIIYVLDRCEFIINTNGFIIKYTIFFLCT